MNNPDAISALAALAQENRLAAFRLLVAAGPEGMPSGDIAASLSVPPTRMSFHLTSLERGGLLRARRAGRQIIYTVCYEQVRGLLSFLMQDCCGGRAELCTVITDQTGKSA